MKQSIRKISLIAAAVLLLAAAAAAFAETADAPETQEPEAASAESPAEQPAAAAEETSQETDSQALSEAIDAYRAAKQAERVSDLEQELAGYVSAGSMTQEQADLILKHVRDNTENRSQKSAGGRHGSRGNAFPNGTAATDPGTQAPNTVPDTQQQFPFGNRNRSGIGSGRGQLPSGSQGGCMPSFPGSGGIFH